MNLFVNTFLEFLGPTNVHKASYFLYIEVNTNAEDSRAVFNKGCENKTKVITLASHKGQRLPNEPIEKSVSKPID